jgi:hypothetical protein
MSFYITRTQTVQDGIRLGRDEVIALLASNKVNFADDLAKLDDEALLEALRTAHDEGDGVWEDVYALLENTGWASVLDHNTDIGLEDK